MRISNAGNAAYQNQEVKKTNQESSKQPIGSSISEVASDQKLSNEKRICFQVWTGKLFFVAVLAQRLSNKFVVLN